MIRHILFLILLGSSIIVQPQVCTRKLIAPACGSLLALWPLAGGQPSLSNGPDQGTSCSCGGGTLYQCVNYVNEYYKNVMGVDTSKWYANASDYYTYAGQFGLDAFPNGGTTSPAANDILVFRDGPGQFGHVAIIESVDPTHVTVIEQNWSTHGIAKLTLQFADGAYTVSQRGNCTIPTNPSCFTPVGWLRLPGGVLPNPVPAITMLSPMSLVAGTTPQTLTINGTGFLATSTVTFNGIAHTPTYVNSTQLSIALTAADLATAGSYPVVVTNPAPGGGASTAVDFAVVANNPVPAITMLSPASLVVGATPQTLTINGTGFLATSTVTFNGIAHTPTYVLPSQIIISLTSADLATAGNYPVVVTNPTPGGGASGAANFVVTAASDEVMISPTSVSAPEGGGQIFVASVSGGSQGVIWTIQEGASGGSIGASTSTTAVYQPPSNIGTFHVVATSIDDPSKAAIATVSVGAPVSPTILYSFPQNEVLGYGVTGFGSGAAPNGLIQGSDGQFYGTSNGGGNYIDYPAADCYNSGCGGVFKVDSSGDFTLLHLFAGADGSTPQTQLIQGQDQSFYGTTSFGGSSLSCVFNGGVTACGTVFKVDSSGNLTTLHSFTGTGGDGAFPQAGLTAGTDGYFYGTTYQGGDPGSCTSFQTPGCGTIFKMDSAGNLTALHAFQGIDGAEPNSTLIEAVDNNFYGVTSEGGGFGYGTVFKVNSEGSVTVLYSFTKSFAAGSSNSLMQASDTNFYGTTTAGLSSSGAIFRMDSSGNVTALHNFVGPPDGSEPVGGLVEGSDGYLYGVTADGGDNNVGTILRMDLLGNVTILHSFSATEAETPIAGLVFGNDGYLYGTTSGGGTGGGGVVFRFGIPAYLEPISQSAAQAKRRRSFPPSKAPRLGLLLR